MTAKPTTVLVPAEPTPAMLRAGKAAKWGEVQNIDAQHLLRTGKIRSTSREVKLAEEGCRRVYLAMLAAYQAEQKAQA